MPGLQAAQPGSHGLAVSPALAFVGVVSSSYQFNYAEVALKHPTMSVLVSQARPHSAKGKWSGDMHTAVPCSGIQLVMQWSHVVSASVPRVSLLYSFSSKRCDVGWSRMFSALAVAARPRRETEECYAVMLPNFAHVIFPLITYFIHHVTEYCTVIGPHSTVRP